METLQAILDLLKILMQEIHPNGQNQFILKLMMKLLEFKLVIMDQFKDHVRQNGVTQLLVLEIGIMMGCMILSSTLSGEKYYGIKILEPKTIQNY